MTKKLYILSDLHIEAANLTLPNDLEFDILILAGDTHLHTNGLYWVREEFPQKTIIYVAGNHEFYNVNYDLMLEEIKLISKKLDIYFLHDSSVQIDNIMFHGTVLWTDFNLNGPDKKEESMQRAKDGMYDYQMIKYHNDKLLTPNDTDKLHKHSLKWLNKTLAYHKDMLNIVITHHAPHINSVHKRFKNDILSASFASNLDSFLQYHKPNLWIHGHSHDVFDYYVHNTRIICNPRGYANESVHFNNSLIIEV